MVAHPTHRAGPVVTSALAVTLLALPAQAFSYPPEVFTPREEIPDAHLRGVTHVVCVTFPDGAVPEVPVYERRAPGFEPAGSIPRARTVPVSRWFDRGERRGWVRLVDAKGTLLLWPANSPTHGC